MSAATDCYLPLIREGHAVPSQSMRKQWIVGFLVTQKDLVDPATYLGVSMYKYSVDRKVMFAY